MKSFTALLGFFFALLGLIEAKSKADSAILLSKVKSLTLHGDKKTSHRRVSAIPQLTCVGGNGCKHYKVDLMRCQNAGSEYDAEDIQWTCSASLPPEFKLGSTEVVCEGYDNADDPWVLKGSCGVEYRLLLTEEGERKYAQSKPRYGSKQDEHFTQDGESASIQNPIAKFLFWLAFIGIVCLILYRIFNPTNGDDPVRLNRNNRPGWGGGGGGGGDGPSDDPPPPYSPRPPTQPYAKPSSSGSARAGSSRNAGARSGPGFWSGAAAGGAAAGAAGYGAGYYQGSRAAEAERRERERQRASTGSWFGSGSRSGSNGGGSFSGGGSSSPGPSSSRHESTGFGGTRRR